jgi:L-aminopeptidase/D-esterase-like protein
MSLPRNLEARDEAVAAIAEAAGAKYDAAVYNAVLRAEDRDPEATFDDLVAALVRWLASHEEEQL